MTSIKKRKSKLVRKNRRSLRRKTLDGVGANDIHLEVNLPNDANEFNFHFRGRPQQLHLLSEKEYDLNLVLGFNPKNTKFECDVKLCDRNGNDITGKLRSNIPSTLYSDVEITNRIPFQVVLDKNEEFINCRFRVKVTKQETGEECEVDSDFFCVSKYKLVYNGVGEEEKLITYYKEAHNQPDPIELEIKMIYYRDNEEQNLNGVNVYLLATLCKVLSTTENELIYDKEIQKEMQNKKRKVQQVWELKNGFIRDAFRTNVLTNNHGRMFFRVLFCQNSPTGNCYSIIPYVTPAIEVLSKKRKHQEDPEENLNQTKKQKSVVPVAPPPVMTYANMPVAPPPAVVSQPAMVSQHTNLSLLAEMAGNINQNTFFMEYLRRHQERLLQQIETSNRELEDIEETLKKFEDKDKEKDGRRSTRPKGKRRISVRKSKKNKNKRL